MTPYKGYLIETYTRTVKTSNGFGGFIDTQAWETRFIDGSTGQVRLAKDMYDAKTQIDFLTDPTGKMKEREYLARTIKAAYAEMEDIKANILDEQGKLELLKEQYDRLKEEYKAVGGSDE